MRAVAVAGALLVVLVSGSAGGRTERDMLAAELILNGCASRVAEGLRLAPASPQVRGSAWYPVPLRVGEGFDTAFRFRIRQRGGPVGGGDGFAFVVQGSAAGPRALGGGGQAMGYAANHHQGHRGIPRSLALEFDTFDNDDPSTGHCCNGDPDGHHLSIQTRGVEENSENHRYSLGEARAIAELGDGREHSVRIRYAGGELSVWLDGALRLRVNVDLAGQLGLDGGRAWVGFTAANGGAWEQVDVLGWTWSFP